ncbi:unnamed protein product [Schistocephalus solidus]|uniref:Fork-head domain-containing protein n=1 Tax=Schistocephalus solidus TaxID=70667 RepID=A0A183SJR7_SCHSO|nr:unnamed protein product [Schistocephalus solidus]
MKFFRPENPCGPQDYSYAGPKWKRKLSAELAAEILMEAVKMDRSNDSHSASAASRKKRHIRGTVIKWSDLMKRQKCYYRHPALDLEEYSLWWLNIQNSTPGQPYLFQRPG